MKLTFKKIILLAALIIITAVCFSFSASALDEKGKCGENVFWNYNSDTKELVLSGMGPMDDKLGFASDFTGEDIKTVVIEDGITTIGNSIFSGCDNLVEVTIPESVTVIGNGAFNFCVLLESVVIPESVTFIGEYAFNCCDSLRNAEIGSNVVEIGQSAFSLCGNLEEFTFRCDKENFSKITTVPELGETKIKELILPPSIESIGSGVFPETIEKVTVYNPDCEISSDCGLGSAHIITGFKGSTAEEIAFSVGARFVDVETVHTHEYKSVKTDDYCSYERCICGKEKITLHSYVVTKTVEATCANEGSKTFTCSCGDFYTESIEKKAHTVVADKAVEATCTAPGLTEGSHCSVCKEVFVEQNEIPALEHRFGLWLVCREPVCGKSGEKRQYCLFCGYYKSEAITASDDHKWVLTDSVDATCTVGGAKYYTCSVCGTEKLERTSATNKHKEKNYVIKASEEENGKIVTVCSSCTREKESIIYAISSVSLSAEKYVYNGKTITPSVVVKDSKGKVLRPGTDYSVSSSAKGIGRHTVTVKFKGNYSGKAKLSFDIIPQTPSTVKLSSVKEATMVISWKAVSGATGYRVYQYNPSTKKYKSIAFVEGKTSYTVSSLKAGTEYKFKVRAYTETADERVIWSTYSKEVFAVTKLPVVTFSKLIAGSKQFTATWKTLSGITGYEIEYSTSSKFTSKTTKKVKVKSSKTNKTTVKKLTKGKKYYVRIRAYKTVNGKPVYGAWSAVKNIKAK